MKSPSRKMFVRTHLRDINSDELMRELQRRKVMFPRYEEESPLPKAYLNYAGDEELIAEFIERELVLDKPEYALDLLRYGVEDKDWLKVQEALSMIC